MTAKGVRRPNAEVGDLAKIIASEDSTPFSEIVTPNRGAGYQSFGVSDNGRADQMCLCQSKPQRRRQTFKLLIQLAPE